MEWAGELRKAELQRKFVVRDTKLLPTHHLAMAADPSRDRPGRWSRRQERRARQREPTGIRRGCQWHRFLPVQLLRRRCPHPSCSSVNAGDPHSPILSRNCTSPACRAHQVSTFDDLSQALRHPAIHGSQYSQLVERRHPFSDSREA